MSEKSKTSNSRYESIRVPILRASEYLVWKVKMVMFLEATDPEYLDRIYDGPHMPTKLKFLKKRRTILLRTSHQSVRMQK